MTKLTSIFLLVILSFQLSIKMGVQLWYEINQTYISTVLCENRNTPMLHCNGQCVLAKKLKQAEADKHGTNPLLRITTELSLFIITESALDAFLPTVARVDHFTNYSKQYFFSPIHSIFHPPCFI